MPGAERIFIAKRGRSVQRAVALALVLLVNAACSPKAPVDDADPDGMITTLGGEYLMDPQLANSGGPDVLMVFEPPLRLDPKTLRPVPGATQLPQISSDGLVYRLTIRDDAKFSDGTPVRARDFAFGITRLCDPAIKGPYASVAYMIVGCSAWSQLDPARDPPERLRDARAKLVGTGVRATGERELTIQLAEPAAYFSAVLTLWSFAPVRETDLTRGGELWTEPDTYIGNGPYVLSSWKHDERMVFVPNRYYRTPAKIKRWTKLFITEPAVALSAYRQNEIDVFSFGAGAVGTLVKEIEGDRTLAADLHRRPNGCTNYFVFNTRRSPFDDASVRLAFAKAIDREAYVREVLGGVGVPAVTFIPNGVPGYDPGDAVQRFDPVEARRLLASSRYAGGETLRSIVYPVSQTNVRRTRDATWLQAQWESNLGLKVAIQPLDAVTFGQLQSRTETIPQINQVLGWCSDYPDQQDWLSLIFHSESAGVTTRLSGFSDREFDRLVSDADHERDQSVRDRLYQSASRLLSANVGAVFLYNGEQVQLRKPWVRGVEEGTAFHPEGVFVTKQRH